MDWGRAKNVLIYAFLLLNLVLGYQLWIDARESAGSSLDFTSLGDSTQRLMEEKGIQILAPIPSDTPAMPKLTYRYLNGDKAAGIVQLDESIDSKLVFSEKEMVAALKNIIPDIEQYELDPLANLDASDRFILHPLAEQKWPLFHVNLELYYSNQKITAYRQSPIEMSTFEEEQQVLPASKALGTLVELFLPNEAVVQDITLGYYGEEFNSDSQVAAPAWRFVLEGGQTYYVQGISGEVISPKTEKPEE